MATGGTNHQPPIDGGWAWLIVLGNFVSLMCMVGMLKSFGIFLNEFCQYFNVPVALAALIMGVCGGVYTIAAPVCMAAGEHFGQRRVVMVGGLIGGLGLSLSGLLLSIEWVIVTFGALLGFGNACLFGNGLVMIGQYFNKRRSLANGLAQSGASIGQFALPPLLQYLMDTYALKGTLVIMGAIYFHAIACGTLYRPITFYTSRKRQPYDEVEANIARTTTEKLVNKNTEQDSESTDANITVQLNNRNDSTDIFTEESTKLVNEKEDRFFREKMSTVSNGIDINNDASNRNNGTGELDETREENTNRCIEMVESNNLLNPSMESDKIQKRKCATSFTQFLLKVLDFRVCKDPVVIVFVMAGFLLFFGYCNFVMFMPATAEAEGITKSRTAWLVSINGLTDLVGRILVGVAGDLGVIQRYKLMVISAGLCGAAIVCFTFADTFTSMAVFVAIYGFTGGCYISINVPTLIDFVGMERMPKVLGVMLFIHGLAFGIGQPLQGSIRDATGRYADVHYINAAAMMSGSALLLLYPLVKRRGERTATEQHIPR